MTASKQSLRIPEGVTNEMFESVLERLVETGGANAETINDLLIDELRTDTEKQVNAIAVIKKPELFPKEIIRLLTVLRNRFHDEANMCQLHPGLDWDKVMARLEDRPEKLWPLYEMERTGGQPDVTGFDEETGEFIIDETSEESPLGIRNEFSFSRRNVVYDPGAQLILDIRGGEVCNGNAIDIAKAMGVEIISKEGYLSRLYQKRKGRLNQRSWEWVRTPENVREADMACYVGNIHEMRTAALGFCNPRIHLRDGGFRCTLRV